MDKPKNDVIAKGAPLSKNQYQESIWANSITRDFYETLKKGTETVVDKIFVTGITPVMLDDLTSGFNISNNMSLEPRYNEILGLTRAEVEWVMEQIQLDKSLITVEDRTDVRYLAAVFVGKKTYHIMEV